MKTFSEYETGQLDPTMLFFLSNNKLWQLELGQNKHSQKLVNDKFVVDYDLDLVHNRLFWTDQAGHIYSRHIDDVASDKFAFPQCPTVSGTRIAYDSVTDKFYIIDEESLEMEVLDSQCKNRQTILFGCESIEEENVIWEKPRKVVLDPHDRLMFILTDLNGVRNVSIKFFLHQQ